MFTQKKLEVEVCCDLCDEIVPIDATILRHDSTTAVLCLNCLAEVLQLIRKSERKSE
jgi:hypothetical protein